MGNELTSDFSSLDSKDKKDVRFLSRPNTQLLGAPKKKGTSKMKRKLEGKDFSSPKRQKKDMFDGMANLIVKTNKKIETGAVNKDCDVMFRLETSAMKQKERDPMAFGIVLDVSGSMRGDPIENAKEAVRMCLNSIQEGDYLCLVTFDTYSRVVFSQVIKEGDINSLHSKVDQIKDRDCTNLMAGVQDCFEEMKDLDYDNKQMLLMTDGKVNRGMKDQTHICKRIKNISSLGLKVSCVGLGTDYNEKLMTSIRDAGKGDYIYVEDSNDLDEGFGLMIGLAMTQLFTEVEVRFKSQKPFTFISKNLNGVVNWRSMYSNDSRKCLLMMDIYGRYDVDFITIEISFKYKKQSFKLTKSISLNELVIDPDEVNGVKDVLFVISQLATINEFVNSRQDKKAEELIEQCMEIMTVIKDRFQEANGILNKLTDMQKNLESKKYESCSRHVSQTRDYEQNSFQVTSFSNQYIRRFSRSKMRDVIIWFPTIKTSPWVMFNAKPKENTRRITYQIIQKNDGHVIIEMNIGNCNKHELDIGGFEYKVVTSGMLKKTIVVQLTDGKQSICLEMPDNSMTMELTNFLEECNVYEK